jgi:hypothetical protein
MIGLNWRATMTMKLAKADIEALRRALERGRDESDEYCAHLDRIAAQRGWPEAAASAAYHLQVKVLGLKPWQAPPCSCHSDEIGRGYGRSRTEVLLRRRMLRAGISLYEPDPAAALEKITEGAADTPAVSVTR